MKKPILLTGSHRSGTTWAANMLAAAPELGFIMEPFNDANNRRGIFNATFGNFFPYVTDENEHLYLAAAEKTIGFRYDIVAGIKAAGSVREYARVVRDMLQTIWHRMSGKRPFVKDPNALFLVEWLAERFDMEVTILIRHPAAFISSLRILNWGFPFSTLLNQPALISDYLSLYEDEIVAYAGKEHDIIDQGILVWKILHHVIAEYQDKHSDWFFIRHEDLSADPEAEFQKLFENLDLDFSDDVREFLIKHTASGNKSDTTSVDVALNSRESISRDSKKNIWNWKQRLTNKEISHIRKNVEPVSSIYYSDRDW
ncbi:MAG: sulfotransferase [Desulfobacteraceae bacterium]|nr:sulfotransferase [Desulfobacteraceae bacterium]